MSRQLCFYAPPDRIIDVPGVKKDTTERLDCYTGFKDELVNAGLLAPALFPGEPSLPLSSVILWPAGVEPDGHWTPGRMTVTKNPSGKFKIALAVSRAEQDRREADAVDWRKNDVARSLRYQVAYEADALEPEEFARVLVSAIRQLDPRYGDAVADWLEDDLSPAAPAVDPGSARKRPQLRLVPTAPTP